MIYGAWQVFAYWQDLTVCTHSGDLPFIMFASD